jgi:hypothetical protein
MRLKTVVFALLIVIHTARVTEAQQQNDGIPKAIETLRQSASSKTEFTFDHDMLVLMSKADSDNEAFRRVIAGVSGISVHTYHFRGAQHYDPAMLSSVNEEYRAAGWKRLLNRNAKDEATGMTDIWVRLENNAISNVAILVAKSNEVNFVVVSGSISPLDLTHLGGHFGIPKLEAGVQLPN